MNLLGRQAVDLPFGHRDSLKDRDGFLLYPVGQRACGDKLFNLGERAAVLVVVVVLVAVVMVMAVAVRVTVGGRMGMFVRMLVGVFVSVPVSVGQMDIELNPFDAAFMRAAEMEMVTLQPEMGQCAFEFPRFNSQVNQRADEHVAADPAE